MSNALLQVKDLHVQFNGQRKAQALSGINFEVAAGEVLTLLGESGSGKSVTLRTLLRLHSEKTTRITGEIIVDGQNVLSFNEKALNQYRGRLTSMIFQEPGLAFDPVYTIGQQLTEVLRAHEQLDASAAQLRALDMLERVQIPQARKRFDAYPHELSGGPNSNFVVVARVTKRNRYVSDIRYSRHWCCCRGF